MSVSRPSPFNRFFGHCWKLHEGVQTFDHGAFVQRLLLNDTYILESNTFQEIPLLIKAFGVRPLELAIEEGALEILYDPLVIGETGYGGPVGRSVKLRNNSFCFQIIKLMPVTPRQPRDQVSEALQTVMSSEGPYKELRHLKSIIGTRLRRRAEDAGKDALRQAHLDFTSNHSLLAEAISKKASQLFKSHIDARELDVAVDIAGEVVTARTNLASSHGLTPAQEHAVLQKALLALCNLNSALEEMREFLALQDLSVDDMPVLGSKLNFLHQSLDPSRQASKMMECIDLTELPDLSDAAEHGQVALERVLEIRQDDGCRAFRGWLREWDEVNEEEVLRMTAGMRARLARLANSGAGKTLRVLASVGIGFIPVAGTALGGGLGVLDMFLLDKLLPRKSVAVFLNDLYPSIFREQ